MPITLFEVPFTTAMSDSDSAQLKRALDLSWRMHPKMRARHESPGLARLDRHSGLFLTRGPVEGQWVLQARTWGHPIAQSVHEWHVLAAAAAHGLDPAVSLPERLPVIWTETLDFPVGTASNKRLSRIRRRIVGLP